jgi:hypothetical protein
MMTVFCNRPYHRIMIKYGYQMQKSETIENMVYKPYNVLCQMPKQFEHKGTT